ncbi:protein LURP-one-related 7 [Citrus sinensis]|uniref:Protein LURP-one-related 7 n=1 Tax=Citrus sinensis TaxID=2711 RepID=A0ACB8JFZ2_CITSI|nr:protein LURP-one-related 7 [Citrus sinensis]
MAASGPIYTANSPIPVDLFVSKKYPGLTRGDIGFADSSGGIIYRVNRTQHQSKSNSSQRRKRVVVVDSAGNPLISVYRQDKGLWQGFKGDDGEEKELIFKVNRTMKTLTRTEFEVFIVDENSEDSASHFTIKGSPFQKSCTIYRGNSIIAQTSLMYKLQQIYVRRNKFRLTIFPTSIEPAVIVALVVIFLD